MVIQIVYDRCTGCKTCVQICSYGILEWLEDEPIVVNPNNWSACLKCERSCAVEAISISEK